MAQVSVSFANGEFTVDARFGEAEPIVQVFALDTMHQDTLAAAIRIGLTNMVRDSWAGKAGDDVEARQAAADKVARLLAGDIGGGARGPRLSDEERTRNEYLREIIAQHCKKAGIAMPKGKEAIASACDQVYAKNKGPVDKEVARRLKAVPTDLDISL